MARISIRGKDTRLTVDAGQGRLGWGASVEVRVLGRTTLVAIGHWDGVGYHTVDTWTDEVVLVPCGGD